MNLDQWLKLDGITEYYILWYGADCADDYMNNSGLLKETIEMNKGKPTDDERIYIVLSGIGGKKCRYRFALKLIATDDASVFNWEKVKTSLDEYSGRIVFRRGSGFSFYNSAATGKDFIMEEIWGKEENRIVTQFSDYDSVELSFKELKEVIDEHYSDYYKVL